MQINGLNVPNFFNEYLLKCVLIQKGIIANYLIFYLFKMFVNRKKASQI